MLKSNIIHQDGGFAAIVTLEGKIDETTRFDPIKLEHPTELDINVRKIEYINSHGISQWVRWISEVRTTYPNITIQLSEVPYVLLKQISTVDNFLPSGSGIRSILVPYTCEECFKSTEKLYTIGKDYSLEPSVEQVTSLMEQGVPCSCGVQMEIDAHPKIFVKAILAYSPKVSLVGSPTI